MLLALAAAPASARAAPAEKLALWLDGRAAAALHATIAAAAGRPLVAAPAVTRELRHARGATAAERATALAARLHATVLYAHVQAGHTLTLILAPRAEPPAERTVPSTARADVAAAVRTRRAAQPPDINGSRVSTRLASRGTHVTPTLCSTAGAPGAGDGRGGWLRR